MRVLCTLLLCVIIQTLSAQEKSPYVKFGKVTAEELQKKMYIVDSNASAVVLSDLGAAAVEGNDKGWFSISFTRHRVVHILNKNGYDEANVEIDLYADGDAEEKLDNIKAVTYNFENGKIVESKLGKDDIFREKVSAHHITRKFTFPNVKEGCIIEYEYKVISDFIWNLDPWYFQGASPVLWSEYKLSIPQFFSYAFMKNGYHDFHINDKKDKIVNFSVAEARTAGETKRYNFSAGVTDFRWVMTNVPELKEESYTSSIKNHIARIEFQLASQSEPLEPHDYRNTWTGLVKELLNSSSFGLALDNSNNWLSDDLKPIVAGAVSETEKAKRIYAFVRDNFTCTDYNALWASQTLKNVLRSRKGSVSEINLLLTALLRYAGLKADPVLLSTTGHGYASELYPLITSFNYVLSRCVVDNRQYFLDATHERLGFGKLMPDCYNGHARVVNQEATAVYLPADSLHEKQVTAVFIANNEKGNWEGNMNQQCGAYASYEIRGRIKEQGSDAFFKQIQKDFGADAKITAPRVDSLSNYEAPVALHYNLQLEPVKEDILYINPMFGEAWRKNPFTSAERFYPVEMPYTIDETYVLSMEVPRGYVVDEIPRQLIAKLDNEGSASFEYRITQSGDVISLRTNLKINRTVFMPAEYGSLREFFNLVVNKQNEQIVFKKKK
jgi:transglutaminase-like putative cysteine protease